MTKEKKSLLKDICGRIPHNVICINTITGFKGKIEQTYHTADVIMLCNEEDDCYEDCYLNFCKPYLFPLSSMTEEQSKVYHELIGGMFETSTCINFEALIDFFNKNHLDYRGLIPMGSAIDATGLNIY